MFLREFHNLSSLEEVDRWIAENELALLYISRPNCSVCHGLKPQVQKLMDKYPAMELGHADVQQTEELAGRFSIFTVPVLLVFWDGKEYLREARIIHMGLLEEKLDKLYNNVAE
ncbi:thioredoxin family protein [Virgibacillus sediminis]|uniref:Thioredoxin family protein n=1 Tax=Virgibacillus sediminis TaxID=202260 RepID=A0ABV7A3D8_9BACI